MITYFQEDIYSALIDNKDRGMIDEYFSVLKECAIYYRLEDSPCGQSFYLKILAQKCVLDEESMTNVFYRLWQYVDFEIAYVARDSGHFYINVHRKKEESVND